MRRALSCAIPTGLNNETLSASAVEAVPSNFKAHMALAQAWYIADPGFQQGNRAIDEAEKARDIVANLPDQFNPTNIYVILSGLYLLRGDSLAPKDPDGAPQPDAASEGWYRKALATATRGVAIDEAQNERHRQAELARGTPPERIGLVGMADLYSNLGHIQLRLGQPQAALDTFMVERRHDRGNVRAYGDLSVAYLALRRPAESRMSLLEGLLVNPSAGTLPQLKRQYENVEGGTCAVTGAGPELSLNRACPVVQSDLCSAYRDLTAVARQSDNEEVVNHWIEASREVPACGVR